MKNLNKILAATALTAAVGLGYYGMTKDTSIDIFTGRSGNEYSIENNSSIVRQKTSERADSKVDLYFEELGLSTSFPDKKIVDTLRSSSESNSRLERDLKEFPKGIRDQRGQEQLFPGVTIHNEEGELDLFFIGNSHIPYFHERLVEAGIKPYIVSSYQSRNPNPQIIDDVNGMMSVVNAFTRYPLKPAETGKPALIVGDTHGETYLTPFPNPQKLKNLGVTNLYIQAEDVPRHGNVEERVNSLKNGFWGKRNLFNYMKQAEAAGINTEIIGLEPPRKE